MEIEKRPKKIRIVSRPPALFELEGNLLLEEYILQSVNYAVVNNELILTGLFVHSSELRMAQLMAPGAPARRV
jgi:hypothetical protein